MKKDIIVEKYNDLVEDIAMSYNRVNVIDNGDFTESNPYTIFYLNKNESFDKFEDTWKENYTDCDDTGEFLDYDEIIDRFEDKAKDKFDYLELGTLAIYTDSEYDLKI